MYHQAEDEMNFCGLLISNFIINLKTQITKILKIYPGRDLKTGKNSSHIAQAYLV